MGSIVEEGTVMKRWRVRCCIVLGLLVLGACGQDDTSQKQAPEAPSTPAQPTTQALAEAPRVVEITLAFVPPRFRPDPVVVQVGKPVQFKLISADTRHTLIIESLGIEVEVPQKALNENVITKVVTPPKTGTFRIFCRVHERLQMEGTLEVSDAPQP